MQFADLISDWSVQTGQTEKRYALSQNAILTEVKC